MERFRLQSVLARSSFALLVVSLLFGLTIASSMPAVVASHDDDPRFEVYVPEPTVEPGSTQTITVKLVNDAEDVDDRVETARNVKVTMRSGGTPITVKSGTDLIGDMSDGEVKTVSFEVDVPGDIDAGTYGLPIDLEYEFEGDERGSKTVSAEIRVDDRARFEVVSTESRVSVGESGRINLTLENVGSETAAAAAVTLSSPTPDIAVGSTTADTRFAGTIAPGDRTTVSYRISVDGKADPRSYSLEATVAYEDEAGIERTSRTLRVGITPAAEQGFSVTDVTSSLKVGHEGTLTGTIENTGPKAVRNAVVVLTTDDPNIEPVNKEYAVGSLAPGESAPFEFQVVTTDDAGFGPRQLSLEVRYRDREYTQQTSEPVDIRAVVAREQVFEVTEVTGNLRVGEEGTIRGTVRNQGERPVSNAVVVFTSDNANINPIDTEYLVGDLEPGGSAEFAFDIEISESSGAGPRQLSVEIRYRDVNQDIRRSEPLDLRTRVAPHRDVFDVTVTSNALVAGSDGTFTVRVTNIGNETLSEISAKLFTDDPLSSDDDESFIDTLEPGASQTIAFQLSAAGSALSKTYPVSLDFQYQEPDGDTRLSGTFRVPVRIESPAREGPPIVLIVGAVIVIIGLGGAGYYYYRRRE